MRRFAFAALFAVLAAHVVLTLGLVTVSTGVTDVLYLVVEAGAVLLTAARAIAVKRNRFAWALIALGLAFWTVGDLSWTLWFNDMEVAPYPNVADAFYLGMYALLYVALALLLRDRIRPFPAWLTIEGVLAGLALAAVAAGTVFEPVRAATEGSTAVVATTLAYLVCDLLLLVMVLVSFAVTGAAPWVLVVVSRVRAHRVRTSGLILHFPGVDGGVRSRSLARQPVAGRVRGDRACGVAAHRDAHALPHVGWSMGAVPLLASTVAIAMLLDAALTGGSLTVVLAAGGAVRRNRPLGAHVRRELCALPQRPPRGAHRQTDQPAEPACAFAGPRGRLPLAPPSQPCVLRPRRLQGLQRRLRPPGRRRAARSPRTRARDCRRTRLPPRRA